MQNSEDMANNVGDGGGGGGSITAFVAFAACVGLHECAEREDENGSRAIGGGGRRMQRPVLVWR